MGWRRASSPRTSASSSAFGSIASIMRLVLEGVGSPDYRHLVDHFADGAQQISERLTPIRHRARLLPRGSRALPDCSFRGRWLRSGWRGGSCREKKKPNLVHWLIGSAGALHARARDPGNLSASPRTFTRPSWRAAVAARLRLSTSARFSTSPRLTLRARGRTTGWATRPYETRLFRRPTDR